MIPEFANPDAERRCDGRDGPDLVAVSRAERHNGREMVVKTLMLVESYEEVHYSSGCSCEFGSIFGAFDIGSPCRLSSSNFSYYSSSLPRRICFTDFLWLYLSPDSISVSLDI